MSRRRDVLRQGDRPDTPPSALTTACEPRTCSRCGTLEPTLQLFRLLPGSQHLHVCLNGSQFVWSRKERTQTP